jgi:hypothetical protein
MGKAGVIQIQTFVMDPPQSGNELLEHPTSGVHPEEPREKRSMGHALMTLTLSLEQKPVDRRPRRRFTPCSLPRTAKG